MKLHQGPPTTRRRARSWPFGQILIVQAPWMDFVDAFAAAFNFCSDRQRRFMLVCWNNGGGPRVPLVPRRIFAWCLPSLIWPECQVPEDSTGELHWAHHAWRLLDWVGFDCAHSCFFWPFGFIGSVVKLCCPLPSWDTSFTVYSEVRGREWHISQDLRTSNGGSCLCEDEELAWWFMTCSSGMASGGDSTREVQGPTLQGENLMSGLNWLWLTIVLLKALFCECGLRG
jgi:hypothetical protein